MGLPRILKNMRAYVNGANYHGVIGEFEQPKLALATSDWRGGGMLGTVKLQHGLEPLEATLTCGGHEAALVREFGNPAINGTRIRLVGNYGADNGSSPQTVDIFLAGRFTEIDFGKDKLGEQTEHKYKAALTTYRREVDGVVQINIDMIAGVFEVGGVDIYSQIMGQIDG